MSNVFIALMLGAGAGGWVYAKMMRQTGNNTQSALTIAALSGVMAFAVMLYILSLIPA